MSTDTLSASVDRILGALKESASKEEAAELLDELAKNKTGAAPETTPAPPAGPPAETQVTRPNGMVYYTRSLGDFTDVEVLRKARQHGVFTLLYGPPGTGKTALVEAAFAPTESGQRLYTVQGSGDTEVADFIGSYVQLPGGEFKWVDGPLVLAMEHDAALLVDEIALIDPKVMAVVYGVMDGRNELVVTQNPERGVVRAGPNFYVAAACNPNAPGARMSEALLSRFGLQFEVLTDYKLARNVLGVATKIVTAASNLSKKMLAGETSWAPQLRELLIFAKMETIFGTTFAIQNLVACSPEIDRTVISDVIKRTYGLPAADPLRLG